jgi:hypothetical protein
MKAASREPQLCNMACLTVAEVVKGPGVNRNGSGMAGFSNEAAPAAA